MTELVFQNRLLESKAVAVRQRRAFLQDKRVSMQRGKLTDNRTVQRNVLGHGNDLPHESRHLAQQIQSRVRPTMQRKVGIPINDDKGLEHEADVMGAKAVSVSAAQNGASESYRIHSMRSGISQRQAAPLQMNKEDHVARAKSGFGFGAASAGVLTGALTGAALASNPIGWALLGAGAVGLLTTAATSYFMGSETPEPITVRGHFTDGPQINWNYEYDVTFKGEIATIHLDFYMSAAGVPVHEREAYIRRVRARVAEIFDNRINIKVGKRTYNAVVAVNVAFDDHEARVAVGGGQQRKMTLHDAIGRANAMELHPRSDATGYVGAHEVGHHLGLVDEYSEPAVSPYRQVHMDNGIMTDYRGTPHLPERNIRQIKHEIEGRIADRIHQKELEKRRAAQAKKGYLPT